MTNFKLHTDKSSVLKKNTRYVQGGVTDILPNALGWWEEANIPTGQVDDIPFTITNAYDKRPDKIANFLYGRTDITWLILQYNQIVDVNTQFIAGVEIMLPSPPRVFSDILTASINYQAATSAIAFTPKSSSSTASSF